MFVTLIALTLVAIFAVACAEKSLDRPGKEAISDGDETTDKNHYNAPVIPAADATDTFLSELENINYGDAVTGSLAQGFPFKAYQFDALPGAKVTITMMALDDGFDPVVMLYGPRSAKGSWGDTLLIADDWDGEVTAVVDGYEIRRAGWYLILAASFDNSTGGSFGLSLGCNGVCSEPHCPDDVCSLYCENGFMTDPNGCTACVCRDIGTPECVTDDDCPVEHVCRNDFCEPAEPSGCEANCPGVWEPVCGSDQETYSNRCEAECAGVSVAYEGECASSTGLPCESDADCSDGAMCQEGFCTDITVPGCECPNVWEPVCGADGETYANICELQCHEVAMLYWGECQDDIGHCQPVCYSSYTLIGDYDETIEGWFDSCTGEFIAEASCEYCPGADQPCTPCDAVCGSEDTPAEGWYDSCTGYLIIEAQCDTNDGCQCNPVYQPVCGSDGMTYANPCEAECNDIEILHSGECFNWGDEGCRHSSDCPQGYLCVDENGEYFRRDPEPGDPNSLWGHCEMVDRVTCASNADCPQGFYCASDTGTCVEENTNSGCFRTGCHLELCANHDISTNCENWEPEYVCLDLAQCLRTDSGVCGWDFTQDYRDCMSQFAGDQPCTTNADCSQDMACINGLCQSDDCVCPPLGPEVCGADCKTYESICEAECAGMRVLHPFACTGDEPECRD